ncbi:TOBE domain-containing protein [Luteococcus sp. Sow4_B9]|uniref:TOBE domain-containing protein n=1 Tax=Luteococcus sp. Sow4_B9 TaxID=3438792 RepID=UPI003F9D51F7
MQTYRIREAADLLGVSNDTLRRWIDAGRITASQDAQGRACLEGPELARFAVALADAPDGDGRVSARNCFPGLVTRVVRDTVMAQVEIQAGPHKVVSLISREAADELRLEPGMRATARIKATSVVVETP